MLYTRGVKLAILLLFTEFVELESLFFILLLFATLCIFTSEKLKFLNIVECVV